MDKHAYLCLEIYIMNKKQFKKSGVFKDILETTKTKSKVEQFINEPEVSEDEIRKEIYDYEEKFDEENIDDQQRLDAHNSLQLAKELYLEQYNKILPSLNLLSELEKHIMQLKVLVNYNENTTRYSLFKIKGKEDYTYIVGRSKFYDALNDTTDVRTYVGTLEEYKCKTLEEVTKNEEFLKQAKSKIIDWMYVHHNFNLTGLNELKNKIRKK